MLSRLSRNFAGSRRSYALHFRQTLQLSVPVVIGQLGNVLMGVIDNLMIGDLGYQYLSAAALANGVFFIIVIIGIGITFAISPLVAEADAAGDPASCGEYLRQGVWVGLFSSIILGLLVYLSADVLTLIDQPEEDVRLARSYLHILACSVLPMILFMVYKQFTDGRSLTRPAMYITILGLAYNTFANWLLIYGHWGFPRLELDGAGYATLSSRLFMMVLMIGYVQWRPDFKPYQVRFRWSEFKPRVIYKILWIGLPSGLQYFFEVGAFAGAAIMMGWLGIAERAAHQIAINLASITYMIVSGISAGAAIRVGNALGRRDALNMRRAGLAGIYLATAFMIVSALAFILGRRFLPSLYVADPYVLALTESLMIIAAFFQAFDGIQAVGVGILRGMQDVRIPTLITFTAYWLIAIPLGYVLCFSLGIGINGMWYAFLISLLFASIALTGRFLRLTKRLASNMQTPEAAAFASISK